MASDSSKKLYLPGEMAPNSGIYKVLHFDHRAPHEASFKATEKFPACKKCGDHVRFELVSAAADGEKDS